MPVCQGAFCTILWFGPSVSHTDTNTHVSRHTSSTDLIHSDTALQTHTNTQRETERRGEKGRKIKGEKHGISTDELLKNLNKTLFFISLFVSYL